MLTMCQFVDNDRVNNVGRKMDEFPVKVQTAGAAAAPPSSGLSAQSEGRKIHAHFFGQFMGARDDVMRNRVFEERIQNVSRFFAGVNANDQGVAVNADLGGTTS